MAWLHFRGRCSSTLSDGMENRKAHGYEAVTWHSTFHSLAELLPF